MGSVGGWVGWAAGPARWWVGRRIGVLVGGMAGGLVGVSVGGRMGWLVGRWSASGGWLAGSASGRWVGQRGDKLVGGVVVWRLVGVEEWWVGDYE